MPFAAAAPAVPVRAVHLDLKGLPPTPERLLRLMEVFAAAKYNAVLVEWEDTFPWTVDPRFRSPTAYSPDTIRRFAEKCAQLGIEIIPLVQCLGHMETPLNVPGYEGMREVAHRPDGLNPLAPGARELIEKMVKDVLALLPDVRHFHLGGDEAWTLGTHPDTKAFIEKHGRGALYLRHVEPILDLLTARGVRPILWHDMMRDWESEPLRRLGAKADLMVWGYDGHPDTTPHHFNTRYIQRFAEHGLTLWGATAYKGATVHDADLPALPGRQANALAWIELAKRFRFVGVAATAWSRFSTHAMQCEPIDSALDAACLVGAILHDGQAPDADAEKAAQASAAVLEAVGEGERFRACKAVATERARRRRASWDCLRLARGLAVLAELDPRRRPSAGLTHWWASLRHGLGELDDNAQRFRHAFAGLIDQPWLDHYLAERIEPIREDVAALEPRVREYDPQGYQAVMEGRR